MMTRRALTVEDDPMIAHEIVEELERCGFAVNWMDNGHDGLVQATRNVYDVITLDRMLPAPDGLTILSTIRAAGVQTPVLLLSALGTADERMREIRVGGDDYLTKPFEPGELAARVEFLLYHRRDSQDAGATMLSVGPLRVDLTSKSVTLNGGEITLFPVEYRIVEFMITHPGLVIPRSMLFEAVWGHRFDAGSTLIDFHMSRLQKKITPPGMNSMIQAQGCGYLLA